MTLEQLFVLLMMVVVGAAIGGVTNFIAITMLFRPYRTLYIGSWRLPFTPGLIPKRQNELAQQLGRIVVEHLLTEERFSQKIMDDSFYREMLHWLEGKTRKFLHSESSLNELAAEYLYLENTDEKIVHFAEQYVEKKWAQILEDWGKKELDELLADEMKTKIAAFLSRFSNHLLQKGKDYFSSNEGKMELGRLIDAFFSNKGTIANMFAMFLGNDRLADKIQPHIIKFFESDAAKEMLEKLMHQEWENLKKKPLAHFYSYIGQEKIVFYGKKMIVSELPVKKLMNEPLKTLMIPYEEKILSIIVPNIVRFLQQLLNQEIGNMIKTFRLDEMVKEQVQSFSIERLEQIVLFVARRELKMITYLGGLLGGLVGFVQGMITIFVL